MNDPRAGRPVGPSALPFASAFPGPLRDGLEFLRGFLRNPAQVGSVVPSSPQLEQRLIRSAAIREARTVVELGPGTGGTTRAFLKAMAPGAQLLAIELDPEFQRHLVELIDDPRFSLEAGSAEHIADFLAARRLPAPDAIVSGIPFSTMPHEVSEAVAQAVARVLRPGGRFVAYQVRAHVADFVSPYLGAPRKDWEFVNIPPVRVFTWIKSGQPGQPS